MTKEMQIPGIITAIFGSTILVYGIWFVKKKAAKIIVQ